VSSEEQRSEKHASRKEVLSRRDAISPTTRREKSGRITERLLSIGEFRAVHTVLSYASFRSEVDTFGIIRHCIEHGVRVVLPRVDRATRTLRLYEIESLDDLSSGYWGIPEPHVPEARRRNVREMDLVIVPGAAFDEECNRLGYGGGYYDRLLSDRTAPAVALAFEEQLLPQLPAEPHDIRMDAIITDMRTVRCHGQKED
jgi:5-formyltetrahydrofolate cyclo-ligase